MLKFKVQIKSKAANEMPKQVRHDKDVILSSFQNPFLEFDIHLALARFQFFTSCGL